MINRGGRIINRGGGGIVLLLAAEHRELVMRRRRMGIGVQRLLEGLDRARIIPGVDAVLAEHKMRFLLVVRRALARRLATAQRDAETGGEGAANDAVPKFHAGRLAEFLAACNCVVQKQA
jgi:hypothetical protein